MEDYSNREKNDLEIDDDKEHSVSMLREPFLVRNRKNNTSQIAIVGAITCPIESLDYEIAENELLKQDWRSRKKAEIFQYVVLKWTLALLIGLGTGLVGFFNNLAIENIAGFKLLVTNNLMLKEMYYQAFATYAGCNVVLAIAAAALCAYVAPAAAGSGIPEVKAYLNGVDAPSILAPATLFVKDTWGETRSHKSFALVLPIDPFIRTQAKAKRREEFYIWVHIWGCCWICCWQRRTHGAYWCLHSLLSWTGRFS